MPTTDPKAILDALAELFDLSELKFKPATVAGNRALALCYVDARVIQDRLDEVLGVAGWQDEYEVLPNHSVVCRLKCLIDGQWITKVDVGSPSEQPDDGDRMKAAFSDAIKRAAVKFGVGRYLYRLPVQWVDYDVAKRRFAVQPTLPAQFTPAKQPTPAEQDALVKLREPALEKLYAAAKEGLGSLEKLWKSLPKQVREVCLSELPRLKEYAQEAADAPVPR